jgi:excisionase family DNA binding protein
MTEFLTTNELASLLKVKPGTVYSWISRKVDVPHIKIGGTVRYNPETIEKWLQEKERNRRRRNFEL